MLAFFEFFNTDFSSAESLFWVVLEKTVINLTNFHFAFIRTFRFLSSFHKNRRIRTSITVEFSLTKEAATKETLVAFYLRTQVRSLGVVFEQSHCDHVFRLATLLNLNYRDTRSRFVPGRSILILL